MTIAAIQDLEARAQAAWTRLTAQLAGLAPYLERSDEPGRVDDPRGPDPPALPAATPTSSS